MEQAVFFFFTLILNHQNTQIQTRGLPFQQYHRLNIEQYEHNDEPSNKIEKSKNQKKTKISTPTTTIQNLNRCDFELRASVATQLLHA
jgi:hypothetical protein